MNKQERTVPMLKLSDAELANLRLACWIHVNEPARSQKQVIGGREIVDLANGLVDWCLQPRSDGE